MAKLKVNLHSGQEPLFRERRRYNVWRCGRRFGKTIGAGGLLLECVSNKIPVSYYTPTATDFEKRWVEYEREFAKANILKSAKVSQHLMEFKNGSWAHFFGLHRMDGVRGNKYARAIIDEAASAPNLEEAWTFVVLPTLLDYSGDAYFLSTPKPNYFRVLSDMCAKDPRWIEHHKTTYDNPYIPAEEIDALKSTMSSIAFRQEILAEFVDIAGALVRREWIQYVDAIPDGCTYVLGVDLAISQSSHADYTAFVVTAKDADNRYYVAHVERQRLSFYDTQARIKQLAQQYNVIKVSVESVAYQAAVVQELRRTTMLTIQAVTPNRDKISRFHPVAGKYEHGYINHLRNLPPYFEDELLAFPESPHDDMVDALQISISGHSSGVVVYDI